MGYIVFICGHNAGRSQMAQAIFNHFRKSVKHKAISAGTRPGDHINPSVVLVMKEIGIDMTNAAEYFPKSIDSLRPKTKEIERVIVACDNRCEIPFLDIEYEHWNLPDPHDKTMEEIRRIRDMVKRKVLQLLEQLE